MLFFFFPSGRDEFSSSSTSPKCGKPQTNVIVSSDMCCNNDSELIVDDTLSLSCCNASSLDLNTYSAINVIHASVDSPCISSKNYLDKSLDDMFASSSSTTHCLMAKSSSSDDNDNDNDNIDEEENMEKVNALLQNKGLMILKALPSNKSAQANLFEIGRAHV